MSVRLSHVKDKENLNPSNGFKQLHKQFPPMPKMEDDLTYHLTDAEEEDDEVQEEKKLMAILLKLTSAKENVTSSKKRKHCEKIVHDEAIKYQRVVKDMVTKFHNKRSYSYKKMKEEGELIIHDLKVVQNEYENNIEHTTQKLKKRKQNVDKITTVMANALHRDMRQISNEYKIEMEHSIDYIKNQITYKFEQLECLIFKSNNDSKDDKLSKMIQTVIASL